MPTYVYECPKCKSSIEFNRPIEQRNDLPLCAEQSCNVLMERVMTSSAFHLKGGGWFKDGYSKK